ncbi:MAG: hypothetical protein ACOH2T_19185 [Pseudomonas sp.]
MSIPLNKMTKAQLLMLIAQQEARIAVQDRRITLLECEVATVTPAPMSFIARMQARKNRAIEYCRTHRVRVVPTSVVERWKQEEQA